MDTDQNRAAILNLISDSESPICNQQWASGTRLTAKKIQRMCVSVCLHTHIKHE